jgi:hypothetical protein
LGVWRTEHRGRKASLPLASLLQGLLFHLCFPTGTFAEHVRQLIGRQMSEGTLAERRAALPWPIFLELLRQALRPLAQPARHPTAYWRGWRLVAWDGVRHSLTNTPQVLAQRSKAKARRHRAAWVKLTTVVLLELGLHNPLAAAIGHEGESEYALTRRLIPTLPKGCLLLADRLSGVTALVAEIWDACQTLGSHFLIRVRRTLRVLKRRRLYDGSRLITVGVCDPQYPRHLVCTLQLREIVVRVRRPGGRAETIRLWTSLLDPRTAPALELAQLYAQRWEQELYWRQMKLELRKSEVLQSHTVATAAQEIAMLILATALIAQERARAAAGQLPALRISFVKCLELLRPLWLVLCLAGDVLSPKAKRELARVFDEEIRRARKAKRRHRSCLRAVRQPVTGWPRLLKPKYHTGKWSYRIVASTRK